MVVIVTRFDCSLTFFLFQHMIENYSNLMYQNMANQRQQGAPPPPGKGSRKNKRSKKLSFFFFFRRQTRVWKSKGLESRWPWTLLVLAPPPNTYD